MIELLLIAQLSAPDAVPADRWLCTPENMTTLTPGSTAQQRKAIPEPPIDATPVVLFGQPIVLKSGDQMVPAVLLFIKPRDGLTTGDLHRMFDKSIPEEQGADLLGF